ncbi:MAG: zinc-ribbon domain-containing protein, partial [Sphingomonas sp.]
MVRCPIPEVVCANCGHSNRPNVAFCEGCGSRLGSAMAAPTPPVGLSPAQLDAMLSQHSQKSAAPPAPPMPPPQPTSITCTN